MSVCLHTHEVSGVCQYAVQDLSLRDHSSSTLRADTTRESVSECLLAHGVSGLSQVFVQQLSGGDHTNNTLQADDAVDTVSCLPERGVSELSQGSAPELSIGHHTDDGHTKLSVSGCVVTPERVSCLRILAENSLSGTIPSALVNLQTL